MVWAEVMMRLLKGCQHPRSILPMMFLVVRKCPGRSSYLMMIHIIWGGSIAETIRGQGEEVTLVTPYAVVSPWTELTLEQSRIQCRLLESGIDIKTSHKLVSVTSDAVTIECSYTGQATCIQCNSIVLVTSMMPRDALYFELTSNQTRLRDAGIKRVTRIGDCYGPGTIAAAVYSGHKYGRELGSISLPDEVPFKRESPALSEDFPPKFQ